MNDTIQIAPVKDPSGSHGADKHWANMGESTFVFGIWLLFWLHHCFGRWPFRLCAYPAVFVHWALKPTLRFASMQYLQRVQTALGALGHAPTWRDSLKHVCLFADTMLDKLLAVSGRYRFEHVRIEAGTAIDSDLAAGRGGVIMTAHTGCLELCRALAQQNPLLRLNVLVHTRHARQFNQILARLNPEFLLNLIEVTQFNPVTALLLQGKIVAGEFVVIAGDRVPVAASQTTTVDFLGHPAAFPVGPYVLASVLKCPLWLLSCVHEDKGYLIQFQQLATHVLLPRKTRALALQAYAAQFANALSHSLKRAPYDWFNFFPFWDQINTKPDSQPHK